MFPKILLDNEESQHREGTRAYVTFIKWIGEYAKKEGVVLIIEMQNFYFRSFRDGDNNNWAYSFITSTIDTLALVVISIISFALGGKFRNLKQPFK